MFLENLSHLQENLFGIQSQLSEKKQKKLRNSQEAFFYELIFSSIDEKDFSPLFSEIGSRPNAPVNVLVASIIFSQKKGWTDEELFDHIDFDLRFRIALGLNDLDSTPFCPATYYNFKNRLLTYFTETEINLIEQVFDKLTDAQLKKLKIKTDIQRMDSFQAMSNIRSYSRTQLLIEVLIRLYRILNEQDQVKYQETLNPYLSQTSNKYMYSLNKSDIPHEQEKLASIYYRLYEELKHSYSSEDVFGIFERVYREHFYMADDKVAVKNPKEIPSSSLQSPDDIDATFRQKRGTNYHGEVVNIAETANPENDINLINDVAVESNNTDDSTLLNNRIDTIKKKTPELNELHTDGAYGSKDNDKKMEEHNVTQIQTAVRGKTPAVAINIEETAPGEHTVSCPLQSTQSEKTRTRFKVCFDATICAQCPHSQQCQTIEQKDTRVFYFTDDMVKQQERIHAIEQLPLDKQKIRPNIEATVKEYTKAFNHKGKLRIRGKFNTMLFAFTMSISINFGRIYRYMLEKPDLFPGCRLLISAFRLLFKEIYRTLEHGNRYVNLFMPKFQRTKSKVLFCQNT